MGACSRRRRWLLLGRYALRASLTVWRLLALAQGQPQSQPHDLVLEQAQLVQRWLGEAGGEQEQRSQLSLTRWTQTPPHPCRLCDHHAYRDLWACCGRFPNMDFLTAE